MHQQFAGADIDPRHLIVDPPDAMATATLIRGRLGDGSLLHPHR